MPGRSLLLVVLPWPDRRLSPNARSLWGKINATGPAREEACKLAREAGAHYGILGPGNLLEIIRAYPPTNRWFDVRNISAMLKAAEDGIFDACGGRDKKANDHMVIETRVRRMHPVRGGRIEFEILEDGD